MTNQVLKQTPSQTVGPFFAYCIVPGQYNYPYNGMVSNVLYPGGLEGREAMVLRGRVFDGEGNPIDDALVEIRQDGTAEGFGRMGTGTEPDNGFVFQTYKPEARDGKAPHINVIVLMRGLLSHVFTRIYFEDEAAANASDPVLRKVPADRRQTLLARRRTERGAVTYQFDIRMQGPDETVFFDA